MRIFAFLLLAISLAVPAAGQSVFDQIGYTDLVDRVGPSLENGAGIENAIVEARVGGNYRVNSSNSEFSGKTITDGSNLNSGTSGHANGVAFRQFGNTMSIASGVSQITNYDAQDWVDRVLGESTGTLPDPQSYEVINHSYIFFDNAETATRINRRMDFLVNRDNSTHVVGTNNGSTNSLPPGFGHTYNAIVVGRTDGNHASGPTRFNGVGRFKPDIVAPETTTSNATPIVSAAASLLRERGNNLGNFDAKQNEVLKATLMAGATKHEFSDWDNTSTRPLDERYGAGELNIYNSYFILSGGEFDGSQTEPTDLIANLGWDYGESLASGDELYYSFEIANGIAEASFLLTWNAEVSDAGGELDFDTLEIANLDLLLFDSSNRFLDFTVGESVSTVDNVEHLYFRDLSEGDYTLVVRNQVGGFDTDFGLAWRVSAVPEPSGMAICAFAAVVPMVRRWRRNKHSLRAASL